MRYKKAFLFIADCLLLKVSTAHNSELISQIKSKQVNWEDIVKIASKHLVIPLLYIRIKEAGLMSYLPKDLQEYLQEITDLNRTRNTLLLEEVVRLNIVFLENDIQVIYLKGTAHLLKGLYGDIGERMIGDIDLLVAPSKMEYVANILQELDYKPLAKYEPSLFEKTKHYPRLVNPAKSFAVEVHKDVIQKVRYRYLTFNHYNIEKEPFQSYFLPSTKHLIIHNILNTQLNDNGYLLSTLNLRQQYDLLLLSQITNIDLVIKSTGYLKTKMQAYLIKTDYIFKHVSGLHYTSTFRSRIHVYLLGHYFSNPKLFNFVQKIRYTSYRILSDMFHLMLNMFHPFLRKRMFNHLKDPKWMVSYFSNMHTKIKSI